MAAALLAAAPARAGTGFTIRASAASDGTGGNLPSQAPDITPDGRLVAFESGASDLVPGDTNGAGDVFVHDTATGQTTRVSVASGGGEASGSSVGASIDASGRYVAFASVAPDLVAGDTNARSDVFVHDRQTGSTTRVSVTTDGGQGAAPPTGGGVGSVAPDISADGRYVAFASDSDLDGDDIAFMDVYVHDRDTATTTRISVPGPGAASDQATGDSSAPALSADGRHVAFASTAVNLVEGDTNGVADPFSVTNGKDIFVRDRSTLATSRVSVASDGSQADDGSDHPTISGDGNHVAFWSAATNLVVGDTNGARDVFVHDRRSASTVRASVSNTGMEAATTAGSTRPPAISADGRHVAFTSGAANLVAGDTNGRDDVFVRDRQAATTIRMSLANDGTEADGHSADPAISDDARRVAFHSDAPDVVGGDTNRAFRDVFVRDRDGQAAEPALPVLSVGDVVVHEGDKASRSAVFVVALSRPSAGPVTAKYATADGVNARAGEDYTSRSGTLTVPAGAASVTVKVPVVGDFTDELPETFWLTLSKVANATVRGGRARGTIVDDDPEPVTGWGLAVGDTTVSEGDSGARHAVFTVSLSKPRNSAVTVSYATVDGIDGNPCCPPATATADYLERSGTLSFPPGTVSLTVKVPIVSDGATEASEPFGVVLSGLSPGTYLARAGGQAMIVDDD